MAQKLRALPDLLEDPGSHLSTHVVLTVACDSSSRGSDTLFWSSQALGTHVVHKQTCTLKTYAYKIITTITTTFQRENFKCLSSINLFCRIHAYVLFIGFYEGQLNKIDMFLLAAILKSMSFLGAIIYPTKNYCFYYPRYY